MARKIDETGYVTQKPWHGMECEGPETIQELYKRYSMMVEPICLNCDDEGCDFCGPISNEGHIVLDNEEIPW